VIERDLVWPPLDGRTALLDASMRFVADCMLGKLAKWLRLLGYDTVYLPGADDDELVRIAVREDRFLLTRDRTLCGRRMVRKRCVFVDWGPTSAQLKQVIRTVGLRFDRDSLFTRCTVCNGEIASLEKSQVEGRVPPYVFQTQADYGYCSGCDRIYWRGTHVQHIVNALNAAYEGEKTNGD
jgi:uncharacterized protein with PIN domain